MGIIVGKIPENQSSYTVSNKEVLYAVETVKEGKIVRRIGQPGWVELEQHQGLQWYVVNRNEQNCALIYFVEGVYKIKIAFSAEVLFPTFLLSQEKLMGKDMSDLFSEWASSSQISNKVTDFLASNNISTEKQFFDGDNRVRLEKELMQRYRKDFINNWGMILNGVEIAQKVILSDKSSQKPKTEASEKKKKSIYHHIY